MSLVRRGIQKRSSAGEESYKIEYVETLIFIWWQV